MTRRCVFALSGAYNWRQQRSCSAPGDDKNRPADKRVFLFIGRPPGNKSSDHKICNLVCGKNKALCVQVHVVVCKTLVGQNQAPNNNKVTSISTFGCDCKGGDNCFLCSWQCKWLRRQRQRRPLAEQKRKVAGEGGKMCNGRRRRRCCLREAPLRPTRQRSASRGSCLVAN